MRVVCTQPFSSNPFGLSYLFVNSKAPAPSLPQSPSLSSQANKHNNNKTNNSSNNDADTDVDEDAPAQTKTPEAIKRENSALVEKLQQERKQKIKQTQGYDDVENLLDKNSKNNKKHKIKDDSDEEDSHNIPQPPQKLPGSLIIKPKTKDATATTPSTKSAKDQKADDNTPINTTLVSLFANSFPLYFDYPSERCSVCNFRNTESRARWNTREGDSIRCSLQAKLVLNNHTTIIIKS